MLVLSRRKGQRIIIGDDIVITAIDIRGDRLRIGVSAPHGVTVHREEIWLLNQRKAQEACNAQEAQARPASGDSADTRSAAEARSA